MQGKRNLCIIIPFYNESETITHLFYRIDCVHKLLEDDYCIQFYLINDGSTDTTITLLESKYNGKSFIRIINHKTNLGYGAALRTAFECALEQDFELLITIDADTNYDQLLIPYFLNEFNASTEDILAASPWHPNCSKKNFPAFRFILSYSMTILYQWVLSPECPPLTCYSACFRIYKREVIESIRHKSNGFLTNTEIITHALLSGFRVKECPIDVNYRLFGISKMRILPQIFKHIKYMFYLKQQKAKILDDSSHNELLKTNLSLEKKFS